MTKEVAARSDIIPILGEVFREYGYSGTSLSEITKRTGLGKSSLYHFFPSGKAEMAEAVLNDIDAWFQQNVFIPLHEPKITAESINAMFKAVDCYFQSGNRICLVGAIALNNTRDQFIQKVSAYFKDWIDALALALNRVGYSRSQARIIAEEVVVGIQGALVLARSLNDPKAFTRTLNRLRKKVVFCSND